MPYGLAFPDKCDGGNANCNTIAPNLSKLEKLKFLIFVFVNIWIVVKQEPSLIDFDVDEKTEEKS